MTIIQHKRVSIIDGAPNGNPTQGQNTLQSSNCILITFTGFLFNVTVL